MTVGDALISNEEKNLKKIKKIQNSHESTEPSHHLHTDTSYKTKNYTYKYIYFLNQKKIKRDNMMTHK